MLGAFVASVATSVLASVIGCRAAMAVGLMDTPTMARKIHLRPTPTSGGLGVAVGVALGILAWAFEGGWASLGVAHAALMLFPVLACACIFLAVGFIDDAFPLGPRTKLLSFALACLVATWALGPIRAIPIGLGLTLSLSMPIALAGTALWIFTLTNCVNFMDGANGLSLGCVGIGLSALAAICFQSHALDVAAVATCGAAAIGGFLFWNFPAGRLFAGDSGALFTGSLAALCTVLAIHRGAISPLIAPLLFFPLLADALLTLAWRFYKGRNVLDGHREHMFQVSIRAGVPSTHITLAYWSATSFCSAIAVAASYIAKASQTSIPPNDVLFAAPALAFFALTGAAIWLSLRVRAWAPSGRRARQRLVRSQQSLPAD